MTFIAAYHYVRIFNSWVESYSFPSSTDGVISDPVITGQPFNDAYRYMDWLLTVPLLLIGLASAIKSETDPAIASKLWMVCYATVISWCTYPVVYLFPMLGISGPSAVVAIQLGYCCADIISKCGVGFLIYNITIAKSAALKGQGYQSLS